MDPRLKISVPLFGSLRVGPEWKVEAREIPEHLVYFVVNGSCEGRVEDRLFRIEPGSLSWLMPGIRHELWIPRGAKPFKLYFFKLDLTDSRGKRARLSQAHVLECNRWDLRDGMAEVIEALRSKTQFRQQQLRALLTVLFSRALQHKPEAQSAQSMLSTAQRRTLQRYFDQQAYGRSTPRELAAVLNLSHDYFSRTFRQTFSVSPRAWLLHERIRRATTLLSRPGLTISDVAERLGYTDLYLFSRQFKRVMGVTPSVYQKTSGL